jgi:MYXO-CTERM domain-containing protein
MKKIISSAILAASLSVASVPASALAISGTGYSGSITAGVDSITITITNTFTNAQIVDAADLLSAIYFTASGFTGPASYTSGTAAGSTLIAADGSASFTAGPVAALWNAGNSGSTITVCVICAYGINANPPAPANTIIGGDGTNPYPNANGSVAGNGPHNPFLVGPVTFVLNTPGVTAGSVLDLLLVQFGTVATPPSSSSSSTSGSPPSGNVPEPSSNALALLGLALLAGTFLKRRLSHRA